VADKKNGSAAAPGPRADQGEKVTKKEAVRRALAELGDDALVPKLHEHILERFGYDMTPGHISTTRGSLFKEAGKGRRKKRKKPGPKPGSKRKAKAEAAAPQPEKAPAAPAATGGLVDYVITVQDLIEQLGADQLRKLIDVLDR
jgi:hypothetical protein